MLTPIPATGSWWTATIRLSVARALQRPYGQVCLHCSTKRAAAQSASHMLFCIIIHPPSTISLKATTNLEASVMLRDLVGTLVLVWVRQTVPHCLGFLQAGPRK